MVIADKVEIKAKWLVYKIDFYLNCKIWVLEIPESPARSARAKSLVSSPPQEILMASTSTAVDMFADPWHASQMMAVFTKHYTIQQTLEEQRQVADAEHIANIEKAKHNVIVYAWPKIG
ncbi:hypothetical protein L208DRAFT_276281 [Tricholoma matsutake]|nr:hypothetical protein L208DRAFT_276281 [Tricholoma matsutake 945]